MKKRHKPYAFQKFMSRFWSSMGKIRASAAPVAFCRLGCLQADRPSLSPAFQWLAGPLWSLIGLSGCHHICFFYSHEVSSLVVCHLWISTSITTPSWFVGIYPSTLVTSYQHITKEGPYDTLWGSWGSDFNTCMEGGPSPPPTLFSVECLAVCLIL